MKKLLLLLIIPLLSFGQAPNHSYSGQHISDICDYVRGYSFMSNLDAQNALNMVLEVTESNQRFAIKECSNISNAIAIIDNMGVRYILYDKDFIEDIANNNTAKLTILAHEVGHHIYGHTLSAGPKSLKESRIWELEADEYSGFVMYKLGASLQEAQEWVNNIVQEKDDTYDTHPTKSKRLKAIEKGYNKAKKDSKNDEYNHTTLTAEDYFYKAYIQYPDNGTIFSLSEIENQINLYTKCIQLDSDFYKAYYNRGCVYMDMSQYPYRDKKIIREKFPFEESLNSAINDFTKAIKSVNNKSNKHKSYIYNNRGLAYDYLKQYQKALDDYTKAISLFPLSNTYDHRARIYGRLKQPYKAIDDFISSISLSSDPERILSVNLLLKISFTTKNYL